MKRPSGVIVSTIFLLLGSLFQLLMAVCMALAGAILQSLIHSGIHPGAGPAMPMPAWMLIFMYAICGFCVALTGWGILTAVGLFRLRRWARYSVLVIAGCLTLIGLPAMLISMAMLAVPLPMASSVDAS